MSQNDDERQRAREAILKRRAKLVAYAVAAGVAGPACSGKTSVCLSVSLGGSTSGGDASTGGSRLCLSPPLGGTSFCLSIAAGASYGGTNVCLGMPYGGESLGGAAGEGGANQGGAAGGEAGAAGEGGEGAQPPVFCLSPPFLGDGGNGGGAPD